MVVAIEDGLPRSKHEKIAKSPPAFAILSVVPALSARIWVATRLPRAGVSRCVRSARSIRDLAMASLNMLCRAAPMRRDTLPD